MRTLATVKDVMSFIKDSDSKWVTLITTCSGIEVHNDFYMNFPNEMKELDVTMIEFQSGCIILYVL